MLVRFDSLNRFETPQIYLCNPGSRYQDGKLTGMVGILTDTDDEEAVLNFNAHSVFFCHNHPGGTCGPSPEDIATTLQLPRMLSSVDVLVLDHLIVAGSNTYSMAQHGDLEFGARGKSR